MIKKIEKKNSDDKDWEEFLQEPGKISNKDEDYQESLGTNKKFRFDLHGYSIERANKAVQKIISECHENGIIEILVITGKGLHSKDNRDVYNSVEYDKLKNTIPLFIENNPDLLSKIKSIQTAPLELGGDGALIIKLKKLIR